MSAIIREEAAGDVAAIREVNLRAFDPEAEARLVDALRDGGYVRLSLVAEVAGQVVGHVLFSDLPITTDDGRTSFSISSNDRPSSCSGRKPGTLESRSESCSRYCGSSA